MLSRLKGDVRRIMTLLASAALVLAMVSIPSSSAMASATWASYMTPINLSSLQYGGSVTTMATGPSPTHPSEQTVWAGGEIGYCYLWNSSSPPGYCQGSGQEPAAWAWDPNTNTWDGPYTGFATEQMSPYASDEQTATLEGMITVNGKMAFVLSYFLDVYYNGWQERWTQVVDVQGNTIADLNSNWHQFESSGNPSVTPGPNGSLLVVENFMTSLGNGSWGAPQGSYLYQINSNGSIAQYTQPSSSVYPGIVGPDGNIYNVYSGQELVSGTWQTVSGLALSSYNSLFWGPDARLWALQGTTLKEWTGGSWATLPYTDPYTTLGVILGPNGDLVASNGTNFYELQGGATVPVAPSVDTSLQNAWTTWGAPEAQTSFNPASLVSQGYDGATQDWGGVSYRLTDLNPDGGAFNTAYSAGGGVNGPATSLPTAFGHLYSISAAATEYLDPEDPGVALNAPVSYGPGVNYYLPSNTPGVTQVSAVTDTSVTLDMPIVWKSPSEVFIVRVELESDLQQGIWNPVASCTMTYPTHSCTITGLSPGTQYATMVNPQEPSGGAAFNSNWAQFTTDSAPSGTLKIDNGAPLASSLDATLSVTANSGITPPVAVRFSSDNSTWGAWQALSGTPTTGAMSVGSPGALGDYYAANTSASANQAGTDYMHLNNLLYSETDSQINFPNGTWPKSTYGEAPQAILNSGSTTNSGNDWGAIWQGYVYAPVSGTYTFASPSGDGATLEVNGQVVVDDWQQQGMPSATSEDGTVSLSAGHWYPFMLQYEQGGGGAGIQFEWQQPGASGFTVVPSSDLWNVATNYSTPSNTVTHATGTFSWQFPAGSDGTEAVYAQVLSLDGTISPSFSASILVPVSTVPPAVTLSLDGGRTETSSTTVSVLISAQGNGLTNGSGQMRFQVDSGAWTSWEAFAPTATVTIPTVAGSHTVTAQVEDSAGLTSDASASISYVSASPVPQDNGSGSVVKVAGTSSTITLNGSTVTIVPSGQVTLQFSPSSTPNSLRVTHTGSVWSPWEPYVATMPVGLSLGEINPVSVQFQQSDGSASSIYTLQILPLSTPPTLNASWQGGATATTTGSMTAVIDVSDGTVPVSDLQYSVSGGASWTAVSSASFTAVVPLASSGDNTVTIEVRDPAGNVASTTLTAWKL